MRASSLTSRLKRCAAVRQWLWWQLPAIPRCYVAVVPVMALAVIGIAAAHTEWRLADLGKFLLLMCCGVISVASTPRIMYAFPGLTKDFSSIWVLPTAILLPPLYAALAPVFFSAALNLFVHRGVLHRAVFTAGATSVWYAAASFVFRLIPASFAGGAVGVGTHAFTWCVAVAACEILGSRGHHFMILGAMKLSAPEVRIWDMELDLESLQALFVEIDLGVLITLAVAITPVLVFVAVPTVLLVRRFLVFPVLEAQSRVDAKTGLLNVSTWESEADTELSRAIRTSNSLALALIDIDHFKLVNDTYGHLAGDRVLRAIADALTSQSRDYDRVGRFGGEEFVLLLAGTTESDARKIAERLRSYIAALAIAVDDRPDAPTVQVTISIGLTALADGESRELTDLLAAADSALYRAKQSGRNRVAVAAANRDMGLDALDGGSLGATGTSAAAARVSAAGSPPPEGRPALQVQADPTPLLLCLPWSLCVLIPERHEIACAKSRAITIALPTWRQRWRPVIAVSPRPRRAWKRSPAPDSWTGFRLIPFDQVSAAGRQFRGRRPEVRDTRDPAVLTEIEEADTRINVIRDRHFHPLAACGPSPMIRRTAARWLPRYERVHRQGA